MTHLQQSSIPWTLTNIYWNFTSSSHFSLISSLKMIKKSSLSKSLLYRFTPNIFIITKIYFLINPNDFVIRTCWFVLIFRTSDPFKTTSFFFTFFDDCPFFSPFQLSRNEEVAIISYESCRSSQFPSISSILMADSSTLSSHLFTSVDLYTCTWQPLV